MATKRVGSTGRFGARYGSKIRKNVLSIEIAKNKKQVCPSCKTGSLKRLSKGVFVCKKCKAKVAGKAYVVE
ncbi:MAG: 50S ribosomal protein L37ae [Candidatus Nanoarchaeia archaeon]|nr:50S ribosomal protein L37ae [Candidatus Nanoarchaeia archaeon]MDD5054081.1 50S ribosomal protein L37ae [Candidatus Nanoarchaeia archaeon]MDD5499519.1 50S ribosomal protein L37ae [Candidatus Nanoarchaeia archaeon]